MFNWLKKKPMEPPTLKEILEAKMMLAIADGYDESDGSLLVRAALRGAAKRMRKQYRPVLERAGLCPK